MVSGEAGLQRGDAAAGTGQCRETRGEEIAPATVVGDPPP